MRCKTIDAARDALMRAGVADRMRELARREHFDHEDAMANEVEPKPATWDDVEIGMLGLPSQAAGIRKVVEVNRELWSPSLIEGWEARASSIEARWTAHWYTPEHQRWLAEGGPARLWTELKERKEFALRHAALVREAKGDPAAFEAVADLEAWRMTEMVKLFLGEEAAQ